jgi:hypothetical protein
MVVLGNGAETIYVDEGAKRVRHVRACLFAWEKAVGTAMSGGVQAEFWEVGLSYRPGRDWAAGDIRDFILRLRDTLKSGLLSYCWVAELQQRGAVHYHVLAMVKPGTWFPSPDKSGVWPWGSSSHVKRSYANVRYLTKYLQKGRGKGGDDGPNYPPGCRIVGTSIRGALLGVAADWVYHYHTLPSWVLHELRARGGVTKVLPKKLPSVGGVAHWITGEGVVIRSPWVYITRFCLPAAASSGAV